MVIKNLLDVCRYGPHPLFSIIIGICGVIYWLKAPSGAPGHTLKPVIPTISNAPRSYTPPLPTDSKRLVGEREVPEKESDPSGNCHVPLSVLLSSWGGSSIVDSLTFQVNPKLLKLLGMPPDSFADLTDIANNIRENIRQSQRSNAGKASPSGWLLVKSDINPDEIPQMLPSSESDNGITKTVKALLIEKLCEFNKAHYVRILQDDTTVRLQYASVDKAAELETYGEGPEGGVSKDSDIFKKELITNYGHLYDLQQIYGQK